MVNCLKKKKRRAPITALVHITSPSSHLWPLPRQVTQALLLQPFANKKYWSAMKGKNQYNYLTSLLISKTQVLLLKAVKCTSHWKMRCSQEDVNHKCLCKDNTGFGLCNSPSAPGACLRDRTVWAIGTGAQGHCQKCAGEVLHPHTLPSHLTHSKLSQLRSITYIAVNRMNNNRE